jgi:hypothetical protein
MAVYLGNRRLAIGSNDTIGAEYLPLAVLRGDGPVLDRYGAVWAPVGRPVPSYLERSRGHLVSRYPIAPALLLVPLEAPQVWYFDRTRPGWDRQVASTFQVTQRMAKNASALIVSVLGVCLYQYLRRTGLGWTALPATLTAALGSDLWVVASQAPWQHGPAGLSLVLTLLALGTKAPNKLGGPRLLIGGLTTALMVAFRPVDLVLAVIVLAWVAWHVRSRLAWFLPGPLLIGAALLGWNEYWFGVPEGGQRALEELHGFQSGVFGGSLIEGGLGTLVSPGRGLFIYCPWVLASLAFLPWTWPRLRSLSLATWLTLGVVAYFVMLSKYAVWWAGHTYGPRYWTDVVPIFAIGFALALERARTWGRGPMLLLASTALPAIVLQAIGAFCFPSTWNSKPKDVNQHPGRLWDWADCEPVRCLREGPRSRLEDSR